MPWSGLLVAVLAVVPAAACGPDADALHCVDDLSLDCQPLHDPPTFDAIFDGTLHPTCASGHGTCHSGDAAKAGLVFEDPDDAYAALLGTAGGRARAIPGDPACSLLVERLSTSNERLRMPPGPTPLSGPELCTIVLWIADGAER
jgi:hypothetical protein